jgi:dynein heavy chain, axonemal
MQLILIFYFWFYYRAMDDGTVFLATPPFTPAVPKVGHLIDHRRASVSIQQNAETKRSEFPRFYFVSDSTLLEILSLGSDPAAVVPHFQSGLFDSLAGVRFDPSDKHRIIEMFSREGERVPLIRPVDARGPVEVWLSRLVKGMQDTIRSNIKAAASAAADPALKVSDFVFSRPAQAALVGLQMRWTAETTAALEAAAREEKGALTKALRRADGTLRELVDCALRDDLTTVQRTALETCITVYIHQKEATEGLVARRVRSVRDFEWLRQCRVTWREDRNSAIVSICDVDLEYSYEYLGVKERLVITPLTDVCYVALTQALGMHLGGAPAGPAGTGKTETTKDLGATLGKYVVVFNCSDQMDYKGMGKIFKGLAQVGGGIVCLPLEGSSLSLWVLEI